MQEMRASAEGRNLILGRTAADPRAATQLAHTPPERLGHQPPAGAIAGRWWLRALETTHSSARSPLTAAVDALVVFGTAFAVGVRPAAALLVTGAALVACYVAGVYADRDPVQTQGLLWYPGKVVIPVGLVGLVAIAGHWLGPDIAVGFIAGAVAALTLVRSACWLALVSLRRHGFGLRRTLLVGGGESLAVVARRLASFPEAGLAAVVHRPLTVVADGEALSTLIKSAGIEHVVLVADTPADLAVAESLRRWRGLDAFFSMVPPLSDLFLRPGSVGELGGVPLIPLGRIMRGRTSFPGKRLFDLALGTLLLIVALPVLALAALAIKVVDRGPVLYRQQRVGRDGVMFGMIKLRSMVVDADAQRDGLAAGNVTDGLLFKLGTDPRVTRVGALLRRLSVDELPQLCNVLRGQMSLVGPRPLPARPQDFGPLDGQRHTVLPGITGYWQISGGNDLSYAEMVKMDLAYLHNWSLWLDVRLLLRTVPALLHRHGPC